MQVDLCTFQLICCHIFRIFLVFEIRFSNFHSAQLAGGSEAEAQPTSATCEGHKP